MSPGRRWRLMSAVSVLLGLVSGCGSPPAPPRAPDYGRTPVLFVHGHGLTSADWRHIIAHLIGLGYPREYLYAVDIVPDTMANIPAATSVIAPAARALLMRAGAAARGAGYRGHAPARLDIVSHSMGVVSSRWYAARLEPARVRTWIGLAGANHGTRALCPFSDDAAREMCRTFAASREESAVQVALNGTPAKPLDETPYGLGADRPGVTRIPPDDARSIAYFTVRIEPDSWIRPEASALLDGAGGPAASVPPGVPVEETGPGNYLFRGRVNHCSLLGDPDLMRLVAALLAVRDG